ncbi:MAG: hypothetical protein ACLPPF_02845 [Rhodomicrobium sp.]
MAGKIAKGLIYAAAAAVILTAIAAVWFWPLLHLVADGIVTRTFYPERISWDGHMAWARCDSALAKRSAWPASPAAACEAMHMCINEAPLSGQQTELLLDAIRNTRGCQMP